MPGARCGKAPRQEQLRAPTRRSIGPHTDDFAVAVRVGQQDFERVAQVVMVELIGAYPVHDYLGLGGDEEVKRRTAGTVAPVGLGQSVGPYLHGAAVGLGDETACGDGA